MRRADVTTVPEFDFEIRPDAIAGEPTATMQAIRAEIAAEDQAKSDADRREYWRLCQAIAGEKDPGTRKTLVRELIITGASVGRHVDEQESDVKLAADLQAWHAGRADREKLNEAVDAWSKEMSALKDRHRAELDALRIQSRESEQIAAAMVRGNLQQQIEQRRRLLAGLVDVRELDEAPEVSSNA